MYKLLQDLIHKKESFALATIVEAAGDNQSIVGSKLLVTASDVKGSLLGSSLAEPVEKLCREALNDSEVCIKNISSEQGQFCVMVECYHPVSRLLVLGGGHIAQPLVQIASLLQYEINVIDDRPEFATVERFPQAHNVICKDFQEALKEQKIDTGTSVVIVTRGHRHDLQCLEHVLKYQPGYVGMIGSRRRVQMVKEHLINSGFPKEKVDKVYMPIGIDISAQTPEEIAVSIAAQLIEVRRKPSSDSPVLSSIRQHWELLEQAVNCVNEGRPVVAATIVLTRGSTPRKEGAKMLVLADGRCIGTVGGGSGEAETYREALKLLQSPGCKLHRMELNADIAAEEGMVCGGAMEVFIERLI